MNLKKLANGHRCVKLLVICVFGSKNKPLRWIPQPNPFLKCKEKTHRLGNLTKNIRNKINKANKYITERLSSQLYTFQA